MTCDPAVVHFCGLGGGGTTEAESESLLAAQKSDDWEGNPQRCAVCEEIAGEFGEKSDEDEGDIQRKDRYVDENRHGCLFFDI